MAELITKGKIERSLTSLVLAALASCTANFSAFAEDETKPQEEAKPKETRKPYAKEAVTHYNRGLELYHQGFLNKAIEEYKQAIAADDRLDQAYSNLGLIYISQKNFSKAKEAFDKALAINPTRARSLNGLASVLFNNRETDKAIEKWKQAIKAEPHFASAYFNMGTALESIKRRDEALKSYVTAAQIQPDMANAYYSMGQMMLREKHPAQAQVLLGKAIALAPESEFARDARKQVAAINQQFSKDPDADKEIEMKVVPAADGGQAATESEGESKTKSAASEKPKKERRGLKGLLHKKDAD